MVRWGTNYLVGTRQGRRQVDNQIIPTNTWALEGSSLGALRGILEAVKSLGGQGRGHVGVTNEMHMGSTGWWGWSRKEWGRWELRPESPPGKYWSPQTPSITWPGLL